MLASLAWFENSPAGQTVETNSSCKLESYWQASRRKPNSVYCLYNTARGNRFVTLKALSFDDFAHDA